MRLIDADELNHRMETVERFGLKGLMKVARKMVMMSPTVDAVEVVRCKDCADWLGGVCGLHVDLICMDENDFCSLGERREDETD